ncbi:hypothetical protein KUTeg_000888 [Tegillarca granosa]|uniref:HTH psq-type domain-containing protein n=1 Tax=Tegillarca granosa TaxID=220873 RepID=A0ABQ9FXL4_TEGGR|nr:hypothetical protein KUTeg_000888 [Tegillarca granosa]
MPRKSKHQKQRKIDIFHNWTNEAMARAIQEVKTNGVPVRKAAKMYSVPRSTLHDRISGRVEENAKWGGAPVLPADDELKLVENAKQRASLGIGFTKYNFLRCASELAKFRGIHFKKAWDRSVRSAIVSNGFRYTGISPFNPSAIPEEAFAPSKLYSKNQNQHLSFEATHSTTRSIIKTTSASCTTETFGNANLQKTEMSKTVISKCNVNNNETQVCSIDKALQPDIDVMNSVFLSVPLGDSVTDLPLSINSEGNIEFIMDSVVQLADAGHDQLPTTNSGETEIPIGDYSDEKALEVIESVLSNETILKYSAALLSGNELNDELFKSWKLYKQKLEAATPLVEIGNTMTNCEDLLSIPTIDHPFRQKKTKIRTKIFCHYFRRSFQRQIEKRTSEIE